MRFADNYAAVVAHAADEFSMEAAHPAARRAATNWKLEQATAAYIDASGPSAVINALDMVVLASASRLVMEDSVTNKPFGAEAQALLEIHRTLETNAWLLASSVIKPDQQQELRDIIHEWRRKNPQLRSVAGLRFREFMSAFSKTRERASSSPTSLFSLLFLDPMASMDPTTAAIEEARNTAERAMYYTQRMPTLLNWQVELLAYDLAVQPETKQMLEDTARFSKASEAFAKTAEELPKVISREREAAIQQILDGLAPEERKAKELLAEARKLAGEARETVVAGDAAAVSIKDAIATLDNFVRSVTPTNGSVAKGRPFEVLDYGAAAREIGAAARDLNALFNAADAARFSQLAKNTADESRAVVDHAYRRLLTLLLALVAAILLARLVHRFLAGRMERGRAAPGSACQK